MKLKYTLGALVAAFALAGCSLDVNMYDGVTGEDVTARNIVELSQGSYSMLKYNGGLIDYGYYFWAYGADDLSWGGTSTDEKFDIYDYSRKINSSVTEYAWELGYRTIGNCNKVIEMGAELGADITDEEKVIVGENYYLRALSYFLLVNEFAQPYSNNPTQNPGLPLKLTSDPNDLPKFRSTVAEIYDQVVKDLKDAITYMTLPSGLRPKIVAMPPKKQLRHYWPVCICTWRIGTVLGIWPMKLLILVVLIYFGVMIIKSTLSLSLRKTLKPFLPYVVQNRKMTVEVEEWEVCTFR